MSKVLIIEDRRENIVFIANNILRPLGYDVITARNGALGLEKALTEKPDAIITDIQLPKMSGLQVLEALQEKGVNIPAVVMTFHGTEETAVRALKLGARDYLIKPFTFEEMQTALERALKAKPAAAPQQPSPAPRALLTRIATLEEHLEKARQVLAVREKQLQVLKKQAENSVNKVDMAVVAQRAAAWEENTTRLNELLAQTKSALNNSEKRARTLEEAVVAQGIQIEKYRSESNRLAEMLFSVSEALRKMAQDMDHHIPQLTPRDHKAH